MVTVGIQHPIFHLSRPLPRVSKPLAKVMLMPDCLRRRLPLIRAKNRLPTFPRHRILPEEKMPGNPKLPFHPHLLLVILWIQLPIFPQSRPPPRVSEKLGNRMRMPVCPRRQPLIRAKNRLPTFPRHRISPEEKVA